VRTLAPMSAIKSCGMISGVVTEILEPDGDPVEPLLTDRDALSGGFYELAIQLGPRDDQRLQTALSTVAQVAQIEGPWHVTFSPAPQVKRVSWSVTDLERGQLRGLVRPVGSLQTLCVVVAVREDAGDDWLDVCLPLEALSRIETRVRAFPFGDDGGAESLIWRRPYDDWLAQIGRAVYRDVGFELGAIGFEMSGIVDAESVADGVPDNRGYGVLQPGDQLNYLPATC